MGEDLLYSKSSGGVNLLWGKVYSMTPAHFIPDKLIISQITFPEICMNAIGRMNMTRVLIVVIVW